MSDTDEPAAKRRKLINEPGSEIDVSVRHTGIVEKFSSTNGWGFIQFEDERGTRDVFVHRKQLHSAERAPAVLPGMRVEFYLGTKVSGPQAGKQFAAHVTMLGGGRVSIKAMMEERSVGNERYTGVVKHFNVEKGF